MSDIKLYEFKLLHRRCTLWKILHVFSFILSLATLAYIIVVNSPSNFVIILVAIILYFFTMAVHEIASDKLPYYKKEIEKVKIMDSMTEEWTQVSFSPTNALDSFIRQDNVSKISVRKSNEQHVDVMYITKTGKENIKYSVSIYTAMDTLDLSIFLD